MKSGVKALMCIFLFLCAGPCRGNMPLMWHTDRAASRGDKSSLLDCNAGCNAVQHEIFLENNTTSVETDWVKKASVDNEWEYCDLKIDEWPDYFFFANAGEGGYHISLENNVAFAVTDYAKKTGMENEEWLLNRIIYIGNHYHAFVKSVSGNHTYFLIDGEWDEEGNNRYIVMADIRKKGDCEIRLQDEYSYNSMLTWHSYKDYFDGNKKPDGDYEIDGGSGISGGGMFDSMYETANTYAMYAYLDSITGEKSCQWIIDRNSVYIGCGYIADVSFTDGSERVNMLIDVCNKTYSILE